MSFQQLFLRTQPPIVLHIPTDERMEVEGHENITAELPKDSHLFYHSFNVTKECTALQIELIPGSDDVQLLVLLRKDNFPIINTSSMDYGMDFVKMSPISMQEGGVWWGCTRG